MNRPIYFHFLILLLMIVPSVVLAEGMVDCGSVVASAEGAGMTDGGAVAVAAEGTGMTDGGSVAVAAEGTGFVDVVFSSGRVVRGEIILRNDDVLVLKDASGARFQFPVGDIVEVRAVTVAQDEQAEEQTASRVVTNVKRTSFGFRVAGGMVHMSGEPEMDVLHADVPEVMGSALAADVRIGMNNVAQKHIFVGGQVGYRGLFVSARTLSFIPLTLAVELPLMPMEHAPMIGATVGYGIGVGSVKGGLNTSLSLAYRYRFSRTGALHVGMHVEFQQITAISTTATVSGVDTYTYVGRRSAVMPMLTFGVLL